MVEVPTHSKLSKEQFLTAYGNGIKVIDTRNKVDFANGFLPNSYNIQNNNSIATWAGWLLNYQEQFILVADDNEMDGLMLSLIHI